MILTTVISFETRNERLLTFSNSRTASKFFDTKSSISMSNLDLPEGTKLFINESLCPYSKGLWVMCKKLWNRKRIHCFFTANGIIKFHFEEQGPVNVITHQQDLKDLFRNVDVDAL